MTTTTSLQVKLCNHTFFFLCLSSRVLQLSGAGEGPAGLASGGACKGRDVLARASVGCLGGMGGSRRAVPVARRLHAE